MSSTRDTTMVLVERMNEKQIEQWHERAAIIEFSGNVSRADAEYIAALDVLRDILPQRKGKNQ
jgi:hypothetical protein